MLGKRVSDSVSQAIGSSWASSLAVACHAKSQKGGEASGMGNFIPPLVSSEGKAGAPWPWGVGSSVYKSPPPATATPQFQNHHHNGNCIVELEQFRFQKAGRALSSIIFGDQSRRVSRARARTVRRG